MVRTFLTVGSVAVMLALVSCSKKPPIEIRLTDEQLAWQSYRAGEVLRFGQAQTSKVRTYAIEEVHDRFETYSVGGNAPVYLGPPTRYKVQRVDVRARRTDSLRYMRTPNSTVAQPDSVPYSGNLSVLSMGATEYRNIFAYVDWDIGFGNSLPLDRVIANEPLFDTTQVLLPALRLGGIDYGPVLRLSNTSKHLPDGFPRVKPARLVYYAKGFGVVGFVEGRTLWYRLR